MSNAAQLVFVSGQLANDPEADFETQLVQAFDNLKTALAWGGASLTTVVKITCLVVDLDESRLTLVHQARREAFGDHPPVSTLIPVHRLAGPRMLFEIDAIAVHAR